MDEDEINMVKSEIKITTEYYDKKDIAIMIRDSKHIVLGLIFLKYISDSFESRYKELEELIKDPSNDDYLNQNL